MNASGARLIATILLLSASLACSKPEERKETTTKLAAAPGGPSFVGAPAAGLLSGAVETDVPGELTMRVPGAWIGQQKLTPGHAMFTSRGGGAVITVTEATPETFSDAGVLSWAAKPWTKVTTPSSSAYRPIAFGRSALVAEQAGGKALLDGKPARADYVRLERVTAKGLLSVLITSVVQDEASPEEHALAEASVRSLGSR